MAKETSFGKWLGKSNGMTMISDLLQTDITKEQARAAVTTYCLLFGIEVDTKEWDDLMQWIFTSYCCWTGFETVDDFDDYMCELIV